MQFLSDNEKKENKEFALRQQGNQEAINKYLAKVVRQYLYLCQFDMTSAELIGAYRKLVDTGEATDAEECALLDLLNPYKVQ